MYCVLLWKNSINPNFTEGSMLYGRCRGYQQLYKKHKNYVLSADSYHFACCVINILYCLCMLQWISCHVILILVMHSKLPQYECMNSCFFSGFFKLYIMLAYTSYILYVFLRENITVYLQKGINIFLYYSFRTTCVSTVTVTLTQYIL